MAPTATKVLNIARSQLGYTEGPNNDNKFGRWYGMNHVSYCDIWISWVAAMAGAEDIIGRFAYTPFHANWFKDRGQWGHTPRRAAIAFFDFPDSVRRIQHVGFVESQRRNNRVVTLEANTGSGVFGSQSDGGGCFRRVRSSGLIVGYGYPAYGQEHSISRMSLDHAGRGSRPPLIVDGQWGRNTTRALQRHLRVPDDGVIGPQTRRALQHMLGVREDGSWGRVTRRNLQRAVGATADGQWGPQTIRCLQRKLNSDWRR